VIHWTDHLIIAPILIPLLAGAIMLLFDESRRELKVAVGLTATIAVLAISIILLLEANTLAPEGGNPQIGVYHLGNWPAPFAIVLVVDRLSALMLTLASILATATLVYSLAKWDKAGPRFHAIFQFILMGLNGAFLTGDLFNLFVFFEVLLAASYALVLHGAGNERIRASLHYIAINLTAAMLFLIGVSLIYAVTGTLNMADLAIRIPKVEPGDRILLESGAAILGVAFLVKAGMWPLSFWLPTTYAAASAPAAAMFAIMTKVGVYAVLRLSMLLFGSGAGASAGFGTDWLFYGGIATMVFGIIGVLASQSMARLAGYSVLVSSGTLLASIGTTTGSVIGAALFYLVISTLTTGAFFLLIDLIERGRSPGADLIAVTMEAFGDEEEDEIDESEEAGTTLPATLAILGTGFVAVALLLAGLPPLSGFIAKFALMSALLNAANSVTFATWTLIALIVLSGLAAIIATARTGITTFWSPIDDTIPRIRVIEVVPVAALLSICLALTVVGDPALRFLTATARSLVQPLDYKTRVMKPAQPAELPPEAPRK
jgi:multicomponent K+:H+ antiporter subunit D